MKRRWNSLEGWTTLFVAGGLLMAWLAPLLSSN
jgi:hypothetical protein